MPEQSLYCVECEMEQLHMNGTCVVCNTSPEDEEWDLGLPACNAYEECEACQ